MAIKTAAELAAMCKKIATEYKTLYVMGCFGAPMTDANKARYTANHSYNQQTTRTVMIKSASADTFGFDCVGLIKAALWGWNGNKAKTYGGAVYGSNGVPDINSEQIIARCKDVSTSFSKLQVGELLWMQGHVGIYIGSGLAVECTPAWKNGVQITAVRNINSSRSGHTWTKHGKLPYVSYVEAPAVKPKPEEPAETPDKSPVERPKALPTLQKGSKGDMVKALQIMLEYYCHSVGTSGIDGSFGTATKNAVIAFQKSKGIGADGICGPITWAGLCGKS